MSGLLLYVGSVAAWLALLHGLRLGGPRAPDETKLWRSEYLARRSLRALLAFAFLVIFPIAVAAATRPGLQESLTVMLTGVGVAVGLVGLFREVRSLERRRLAGLPEQTPRQRASLGHAGLDRLFRRAPIVTSVAEGLIVVTSVAALLAPGLGLVDALAKDGAAIQAGELWRLLTVALVHGSFMHLFFNVLALDAVGGPLEHLVGPGPMARVLILGTLAASTASLLLIPARSVGASGGVLALLGALVVFAWRHRSELPPKARKQLIRSTGLAVLLNVALSLLPSIDWAAHFGGLSAGALLGAVLSPGATARAALAAPALPPDPTAPPGT